MNGTDTFLKESIYIFNSLKTPLLYSSCVNANIGIHINDHTDFYFKTSTRIRACRNDLLKGY